MSTNTQNNEETMKLLKIITILLVVLVIIVCVVVAIGFANKPGENAILNTINNSSKISAERSENATNQRDEMLVLQKHDIDLSNKILEMVKNGVLNVTIINQTTS